MDLREYVQPISQLFLMCAWMCQLRMTMCFWECTTLKWYSVSLALWWFGWIILEREVILESGEAVHTVVLFHLWSFGFILESCWNGILNSHSCISGFDIPQCSWEYAISYLWCYLSEDLNSESSWVSGVWIKSGIGIQNDNSTFRIAVLHLCSFLNLTISLIGYFFLYFL